MLLAEEPPKWIGVALGIAYFVLSPIVGILFIRSVIISVTRLIRNTWREDDDERDRRRRRRREAEDSDDRPG